jgi:hypothetical protein
MNKAGRIGSMFQEIKVGIVIDSHGFSTYEDAEQHLKEKNGYHCNLLRIEITTMGFKQAGTKAFNCWTGIQIDLHEYHYQVTLLRKPQEILLEKLYHELPTAKEQELVADKWMEFLLDDVTEQIERIK